MSPRAKAFVQWATAIPLVFVLGVVSVSVSWKTNTDRTIAQHTDSIYVNAIKYEATNERIVELQALYANSRNRVELLEIRIDTLYTRNRVSEGILRELYRYQTGKDWEE